MSTKERVKPTKIEVLVYRQEKWKPIGFTLVTALVNGEKIRNDGDLVTALRKGVTNWAQRTENGKEAYEYAGNDMNIGDLGNYDLGEVLRFCPDIYELEFRSLDEAQNWDYDTRLCDEIEREE